MKLKIDLSKKVLVLYLEPHGDLYNSCTGANCEDQGIKQVPILRMLAIDAATANKIGQYEIDRGRKRYALFNKNEVIEGQFAQLVNIEVPRVLINTNITSDSTLRSQFNNVINSYSIIANLANGINIMAEYVGLSLGTKEVITSKLNAALVTTGKDYQYRYDLLKDLVATYKELKALVLRLKSECCPEIKSFPKHLMLGEIGDALKLGERVQNRHPFIKSPIIPEDGENKKLAELLLNRFNKSISGSYVAVPGDDTKEIKITPSYKAGALGRKAIPYYYKVESELLRYWDFAKTKETKQKYNLSYHRSILAQDGHIQNPLGYNIESNDFYRIEGHLGQDYDTAYRKIEEIKSKHGLSFDVKAVYLKTEAATNVLKTSQEPVSKEHLGEFLTMHAGLNHLAGVQPGGTFVLVYESEAKKEVIADFTLPYLCCQKGAAVAISVTSTTLCGNADPLPINVQPMNGEVKAYVGGVEIPAIIKQGGQTFLDPKKVEAQHHEKPIELKVNGKAVPTAITVKAIPTFTKIENQIISPIANGKRVSFEVVGNFTNLNAISIDFDVQSIEPVTKQSFPLTAAEKSSGRKKIEFDYSLTNTTMSQYFGRTMTLVSTDGCKSEKHVLKSLKLTPGKDSNIKILVHYPKDWEAAELRSENKIFENIKQAVNDLFHEYKDNVQFISMDGDHKVLQALNMNGTTPDGKIFNLVFGGNALYRGFGSWNPSADFITDFNTLKGRLDANFGKDANYFRGAIFPVSVSVFDPRPKAYRVINNNFLKAMEAIEKAQVPYESYNLKSYVDDNKIGFGYKTGVNNSRQYISYAYHKLVYNHLGVIGAATDASVIEEIVKATVEKLGFSF